MPRPRKWKQVCRLPESDLYGPIHSNEQGRNETILMSVEEYETIRLIDVEGLTQEECAERMQVARATVQKLYDKARRTLGLSLVNGALLKIEGGDYILYQDCHETYRCGKCRRRGYGHLSE